MREKKILVAPLNWGLGHATRCVPLIYKLIGQGHEVRIASDGDAGIFLQKQFPKLPYVELPSYGVMYPQSGFYFPWLKQLPKLANAMVAENQCVQRLSSRWRPDVIISDNRYGVHQDGVKNVIITHQLMIDLVPPLDFVVGRYLRHQIQRFDQCWVPDFCADDNLSGRLSQVELSIPKYFVGAMSRFDRLEGRLEKEFDICVVLSGPEPFRTVLQEQLMQFFSVAGDKYNVAFVLGKPGAPESGYQAYHTYNHLSSSDFMQLFGRSDIVISRSGYSSIMDYYRLNQKAILIPTPKQPEQKYLAERHGTRPEFYVPKPDLSDLLKGIQLLSRIDANLPQCSVNAFPAL